jgi:mRNA interferase HicA
MLERDGWFMLSRSGSHVKMVHPVKKGVIIFPDHGNDEVGKGLMKRILKDAGLK